MTVELRAEALRARGVPGRGAGLAGRARARRAAAVGGHRRGVRAAPGVGTRAGGGPAGVVSWPAEYGGRDASLAEWLVFEEEYYAAGAPVRVGQNGLFLLAPTLFAHGTAEQRDRLLPPMARADEIWAQAWSEPEAGSDLAAIRSRAVRGGRRLAAVRHEDVELAGGVRRPRVRAVPHRCRAQARSGIAGLTYLLFGLRAPGVTVRPIRQLGGETGFAEIFLDDVFVPGRDVVGAPGDGWRIAMSTASHERGLSLRSPGRFLAAAGRLVELWRRAGDPADTAMARPGRRRVDRRPGLPAAHPGHRRPAGRRRNARGRGEHGQGVLVRARHRAARDGARPARPAAEIRDGGRAGWRATCSRWPGRSTRARTRSSAR